MKRFFLLFAIQTGLLHAQPDEQNGTNEAFLIYGQKSFAECALLMAGNISVDEMSEFVNSVCYTCFHAHKNDFEQDLRADLGRPNNGSAPGVITARNIKKFADAVIDDLAVVARNFQGEDRELFWTTVAKDVTKSMTSLCTGRKDEHGIEKHINRRINLKKMLG